MPIFGANCLKSEPDWLQRSRWVLYMIDKKPGIEDAVFLPRLSQKLLYQFRYYRRRPTHIQEFVF